MGCTSTLAQWALGLELEAIPARSRELAGQAMLDALACAVAAREEPVTRALRGAIKDQGSCGPATLWGSGESVSMGDAALINGSAAHALDFDDVSWAMNGHPSAPLLSAALAAAEARGASGRELLVAYVAGFEVQARLGQALTRSHYERGWHPTSTLGVIGAATAAARLFGLDAQQLRRAYGIACSRASGSRMNFGTDSKPLHAGLAARAGLEAAEFARRGLTAREDGFEAALGLADLYGGARPLVLPKLGEPFALEDPGLELKPYPSCRFTHRVVDAMLTLREAHGKEEPLAIDCGVDPFAHKILIHPQPDTGLQAKFSMPYCAAVAWLDGWPELRSFSDDRAQRDDVQELLRRVSVADASGAAETVEITFASGTRAVETVEHARGSPQKPLSEEERLRKVRSCVSLALGVDGAETLIEAFAGLEDLADCTQLGRACVPG